jgi:hypothetical protein
MIETSEISPCQLINSCNGDNTGIRSRTIWPICFQNFTIALVRLRVFDKTFESFTFAFCVLIVCFVSDGIFIEDTSSKLVDNKKKQDNGLKKL